MSVTVTPDEPKVRCDVQKALNLSGMKPERFAEALGISLTYLYETLRGKYSPSPALFAKICLLIDRPPADLVYLDTPD